MALSCMWNPGSHCAVGLPSFTNEIIKGMNGSHSTEVDPDTYICLRSAYLDLGSATCGSRALEFPAAECCLSIDLAESSRTVDLRPCLRTGIRPVGGNGSPSRTAFGPSELGRVQHQ